MTDLAPAPNFDAVMRALLTTAQIDGKRFSDQARRLAIVICMGSLRFGREAMWVRFREEIGEEIGMRKNDTSDGLSLLEELGLVHAEKCDKGWSFTLRPGKLGAPALARSAWAAIADGRRPQEPEMIPRRAEERRDHGFAAALSAASQDEVAAAMNRLISAQMGVPIPPIEDARSSLTPNSAVRTSATSSSDFGNSRLPNSEPASRARAPGESPAIRHRDSQRFVGRGPRDGSPRFADEESNWIFDQIQEACRQRTKEWSEWQNGSRGAWINRITHTRGLVVEAWGDVKAWLLNPRRQPPRNILAALGSEYKRLCQGATKPD